MVENTAWSWCFLKAWQRHYCKWVINISCFLMLVVISFSRQWLITSLSHSPGSFSCHQLVLFSSLPPRMMDFWYRAARQAGFATAAHLGFPAQYGFPSVAIPRWDKKTDGGTDSKLRTVFFLNPSYISTGCYFIKCSESLQTYKHTFFLDLFTLFQLFVLWWMAPLSGERGHVSE